LSQGSYDRYMVRKPVYEQYPVAVKNRQVPMTLMSSAQVPEAKVHGRLGWITGLPDPNPHVFEHTHNCDELIYFIGGDPQEPQVLGGEIEFYLGGQKILFNTNTCILIPKGVKHGPLIWREYTKPHLQLTILIGQGSLDGQGFADPGTKPQKTDDIDYEQYVVRSPIYEDAPVVKNRQTPTMTYMSSHQIRGARYYLEGGWLWAMPEPNPHIFEHKHHYDEFVIHFGGDPENPEDLGAAIEIGIAGEPLVFNTTCGMFVPKGIKHGPNIWRDFKKPHFEMALMIGCGTFKEGWGANIDHLTPP